MIKHIIDIKHLTVSFPSASKNGERNTILNDISLQVRPGEFVTVAGPSGCGKSTVLSCILGSHFPTSGVVLVDGNSVQRVTRDCGIVYQDYSLFKNETLMDNIIAGPLLEKTNLLEYFLCARIAWIADRLKATKWLRFIRYCRIKEEARAKSRELLSRCALDPERDGKKYPHESSGGMRQRAAIAQALMMKPKVLLLDEPFSGLDENIRQEMQDFIHEQWMENKTTIFFVTHDLKEAIKLGTRLVCLSQHWTDEEGKPGVGAKIIIDKKVSGGTEAPSKFVNSPEFTQLAATVRDKLKQSNPQPLDSFELTHPDAYITKEQHDAS